MRIAHVIDAYDGHLLYQEGYLAREQLRRGHDVVVLARNVERAEREPRVRVVRGNLPLLAIRLASTLRRERPDVVHVHDVVTQISFSACLVKPLVGYRLVLDSHHSSLNTRVETPFRRIGAALYRQTVGRLARHAADEIFAVAGPERAFTARLLGCDQDRIGVIPLGVDTDVFHPDAEDRRAARARLDLEDDFVVAHAGRLVPDKGLDVLLDATARIGATALLAGELDERLRSAVEAARSAGTRVVLPGVLAKDELASALRAADAAVWMGLPSLSAVEAMAVGLPLVTLETPHFSELLGDDYPLFAADTGELVTALERLRSNPAFSAEVGSRNAHRAARSRAWTSIAQQVERLYA